MKRKNVTKMLAAALASTMVVGLAGCGSTPSSSESGSVNSEAPSEESNAADAGDDAEPADDAESQEGEGAYALRTDENGNTYDLGGMEIIIRDWWSSGEEKEPENAYEEAKQEYLDWIQETYNFTIKEMAISNWGGAPEDFVNYATTGGSENYIFTLRQSGELVSAMKSGLMYDLSTLDCLDFSEDKWGSGVHKLMTKGSAIYGMRAIDPEPKIGMYFNKRLLTEAGINPDDIYQYQENMEWTWDKFEELCEQISEDTDNDGVIDRWPLMTFNQEFYKASVYSNDGNFVGMDENGLYYNDLESPETLEGLNWALKIIDNYRKPDPEDAEWNYCYTGFKNGEAAFLADSSYNAGQDFKDMVDEFGFVCFPMGPAASDYTNIYEDNAYVIPACYDADKAWKLAFAYDLYTEPIPGYEDYPSWKDNYYGNFRDLESVDYTIARMLTNGRVTYHSMISGMDIRSDVIWGISNENTPAQKAEAIRNTWAAYLDEANGVSQ